MNDRRLWYFAGALFFVVAITGLFGDGVVLPIAFFVVGVLFFLMPTLIERQRRE